MAEVSYHHAARVFPGTPPVRAVDGLDLGIADGEFLVLVGPSGSGKSTALRMLAGLEDVDEGGVEIGGRDVTDVAPKDRDIAMVFQNYALYPHMTVADNMAFALKLQRMPKATVKDKVRHAADLLDLTPYLDRKPKALSGGQRQRVAMGRAIVREPAVFLMDEPLSNLDAKLRVETRANIAGLQRRLGTTTVYVTHDQIEAMTMGDRVAVLRDGMLQQCATPGELYTTPANVFVAGFIGSPSMNLRRTPLHSDGVRLGDLLLPLSRETLSAAHATGQSEITVGLRPESLRPAASDEPGFDLRVELTEELGADTFVYGQVTDGGASQRFVVRAEGQHAVPVGHVMRVALRPGHRVHLFSADGGDRIPS